MTESVRPEDVARAAKNAAALAVAASTAAQKAAERASVYAGRPFDDRPMTSAEALGQFRRDLIAEGINNPELIDSLIIEAHRRMLDRGLVVGRKPDDAAAVGANPDTAPERLDLPERVKAAEARHVAALEYAAAQDRKNRIAVARAAGDLATLRRLAEAPR